jgi:hypothetical protein
VPYVRYFISNDEIVLSITFKILYSFEYNTDICSEEPLIINYRFFSGAKTYEHGPDKGVGG